MTNDTRKMIITLSSAFGVTILLGLIAYVGGPSKEAIADRYNESLQRADSLRQVELEKIEYEKRQFEKRLSVADRNISKSYDEFKDITWYRSNRNLKYDIGGHTYLMIELYIGTSDYSGGLINKWLRLKTSYESIRIFKNEPEWISYNEIFLLGDNGHRLNMRTRSEGERTKYGLIERSDEQIKVDYVLGLKDCKSIKVRFSGKRNYDFTMTEQQLMAFDEIIYKFISIPDHTN